MINKIVGYAGFQSYSELPYSALKPGKDKLPDDKIWENTSRPVDNKPHLQNYHHFKTIYKRDYLENTMPEHYHPNIVKKGSNGFKDYPQANTIKTYEMLESSTIQQQQNQLDQNQAPDSIDAAKKTFLRTGVEHWKTNYQHQVDDLKKGLAEQNKLAETGGLGASAAGQSGFKGSVRSSSANVRGGVPNGSTAANLFKPTQPAWSRNDFAQINTAPIGVTDYKFNYGEKIGHAPKPHIMDEQSTQQPRLYHPLKAGTTQLVDHIPGYQGHIPSTKMIGRAFEHGKGEVQRTTFLKNNLIENYHVNIPGYSGFKTRANLVADDKLRSSCFRTNEFVNFQC